MSETLLILDRFGQFAAVMSLFGASLLPLYATKAGCFSVDRLLRKFSPFVAFLALLSAIFWLLLEASLMSGDARGFANPRIIATVLHSTQFGHIWQWRLTILTAMFVFAFAARNMKPRFYARGIALLSALAVITLAGVGHGAMGVGWDAWLHLGNQAAHMLAASVWVGGLAALLAVIKGPTEHDILAHALRRFSAVGLAVVLVILASGLLNAWFLVGSARALFTTPYGHILLVKLALFIAMIALALYNRLILLPRMEGQDNAAVLALLKRSVMIEQGCALAIIAAVSLLGTMEPAFDMKM